jgi:hypothetical protein
MILLRNFYVDTSSWNRYVLDTLAGGNFLGTPALEACTLIESLVGVLSGDFVSQEHGVPHDRPKDSNAGGYMHEI